MGGVKTDLHGETSIRRLFACGEVSATGVHGANRLASNSLSEAIVFGRRIIETIKKLKPLSKPLRLSLQDTDLHRRAAPTQAIVEKRLKLQKIMVRYVGLMRSLKGLEKGYEELKRQLPIYETSLTKREEYEFVNLLTSAMLTTQAAMLRQESRGAHYREDFPEKNEKIWRKHILMNREQGIVEECMVDV
ncbi:MAG TPA: FAD-binding protein, partial [Bacilli bacterium]